MREQAIVLNQLTKHYGTHRGINDLSFSVKVVKPKIDILEIAHNPCYDKLNF